MTKEQEFFIKNVKIIFSPQEKQGKNNHILDKFEKWGIRYEKLYSPNNLKEGDYSFIILDKDYRNEFLIERKFGLEELNGCLIKKNKETKAKASLKDLHEILGIEKERDNLEAEFLRMLKNEVNEKWLFIENVDNFEDIKTYVDGFEIRNQTAGERIYSTLNSWSCNNRYGIKICCIADKNDVARIMFIKMFYYWRNDMKRKYGQNFLPKIKKLGV